MKLSSMNQDVLEFVKALGVGCRHPNDEFFQQGNELNKINKIFGVHEVDDEENYHKSYPEFACHIPGCSVTCETTFEYDQHYNSCHRYSCSQCKKYLPSFHLLNLHIMETHDAYFLASSDKKPMFQCYLQECKTLFQTPQQRKDHCIKDHKFPANFRFGVAKKRHPKKKNKKHKDEETDENCMEIEVSTEETSDSRKERKPSSKAVAPKKSLGVRRKPVLDMKCFVKDMRESLPDCYGCCSPNRKVFYSPLPGGRELCVRKYLETPTLMRLLGLKLIQYDYSHYVNFRSSLNGAVRVLPKRGKPSGHKQFPQELKLIKSPYGNRIEMEMYVLNKIIMNVLCGLLHMREKREKFSWCGHS